MERIHILQVGIGNHARRIYVPSIMRLAEKYPIKIAHGIDVHENETRIGEYMAEKGYDFEVDFINAFKGDELPVEVESRLNQIVDEKRIQGVVIATDPLTHVPYAKWALRRGLHILMDKPISTRERAVSDPDQGQKIESDYLELLELYNNLQQYKRTVFLVNVQRRYEVGYHKILQLIREAADRFGAPVTSIQAMHADGVWLFPDEVVDLTVHPYNEGYGKCSHSGYHLFDIVWQMFLAGKVEEKFPNAGEVYTSFLLPEGLLTQFNIDDYRRYFGQGYSQVERRSQNELMSLYKGMGEIDAFSNIRLVKDGINVCNVSVNLMLDSFTRRSWVVPGKDLYKGNGRVRHQSYVVEQGPFQCIQIHNYQSKDKQEVSDESDFEVGGNNHFDIYVFRNSDMFGPGVEPFTKLTLRDLASIGQDDQTRLYHEIAKEGVILEWLQTITGQKTMENLTSNIDTHLIPVRIMSSIYKSHANQVNGMSPVVKFPI